MTDTHPTIEDITNVTEEEMPELEETQPQGGEPTQEEFEQAMQQRRLGSSRNAKKTMKYFQKLGLKPYPNVIKITLRQGKHVFTIESPEVFKSNGETYVILGEAKAEDQAMRAQQQAALQSLLSNPNFARAAAQEEAAEAALAGAGEEAVDESGLEDGDIDLVLTSAPQGTTRAQAVSALRDAGNAVDAVLKLSMQK